MQTNRKQDLIAGVGFIVFAAAIVFIAIPYGVQEPKKVKFAALSPSYYPRLVCYCLLVFGVLLVISRSFFSKDRSESVAGNSETSGIRLPALLAIAATLLFYYFTLSSLGFVLASTVVLFVLLLLAGERQPWALISLPLLLPIGLYYFFVKVANIPIPSGILEPWLVG